MEAPKELNKTKFFSLLFFLAFFSITAVFFPFGPDYRNLLANSKLKELQNQIKEKNQEIEEIQKEIKKYENEIEKLNKTKNSLKNQILRLETTAKKLKAQINLTNKKINTTNLAIEELNIEITKKDNEIKNNKKSLAELIKKINEEESNSLVEILLGHNNLSDFFNNLEQMECLQKKIQNKLENLSILKKGLELRQKEKNKEKEKLKSLFERLADQKKIADYNKRRKITLLKKTKNKEALYKKLLYQQKEKEKALEEEIRLIEEKIRITIDPASLPHPGKGVLAWPLDKIHITQYFGQTPFHRSHPQIYHGRGHNGIDLRASVGTPVKAAESGKVTAIGDTDKQCRGVSYGKWILIKHNNNLSTIYAHLSLIKVKPGQTVKRGEVIGYSGASGFVTGPHLHFGVFATKAVKVGTIKSRVCGTNLRLPIAPQNGYLNPLSYL